MSLKVEMPANTDGEVIKDYYEVTNEVLGNGFFAVVKLGVDKRTGENVAIKIIDKSKVEDSPQFLKNEIDIMSKVNHPNVIGLKRVFSDNTCYYIGDELVVISLVIRVHFIDVMELVRGGELYDMIIERKTFSEKDTSYIMKQIFSALEYLHSKGIVHRDLKLENMLFVDKENLTIKLADFGFSKHYAGQALQTACGTPFYVAPDILLGMGYGPEVDMWACGVITYVLLSGRLPFYAENDALLFQLIVEGKLIFKSPQFDSVSKEAKDLISKLLIADPELRYTAQLALQHPFITNTDINDKPLHPSVLENLKKVSRLCMVNQSNPNNNTDSSNQPSGRAAH